MPRLPLALKLLGVLFTAFAISVLGIGYWSLAKHEASLEQAYAKQGRALVQALSAALGTRDELNAAHDLATALRQQLELHPDLQQIDAAMTTANGSQVRASTHPHRASAHTTPLYERAYRLPVRVSRHGLICKLYARWLRALPGTLLQ